MVAPQRRLRFGPLAFVGKAVALLDPKAVKRRLSLVGCAEGSLEGRKLGRRVRGELGARDGCKDGCSVGSVVGRRVGCRYERVEVSCFNGPLLGTGTYGEVYKGRDKVTGPL